MASSSRQRRLLKELKDMQSDATESGITLEVPDESNYSNLIGIIPGPPDTPYTGGKFLVDINIPDDYPFKPPKMQFKTRVWHPNISSQTGAICLDTLNKAWSPVQTLKTALLSLRILLEMPEPKDPQDHEVARQMMGNPQKWARQAQDWSIRYASAPSTEMDFSKYEGETIKNDDVARYEGYHPNVVNKFTEYGFQVENIVKVFKQLRLGTLSGSYFLIPEDLKNVILNRLIEE